MASTQNNDIETSKPEEKKKVLIYQAKARNNSNNISLKGMGWVYNDEKIYDEPIDLDDKNTKFMPLFGEYYAKFYKNRIPLDYLLKSKRTPVLYATVEYNKKFVRGVLFSITLYFTQTEEIKYKNINEFLNSELHGEFYYEILLDNMFEENKTMKFPIEKFINFKESISDIKNMLNNDIVKDLIKEQMSIRDKERLIRLGTPDNFKIPDVSKIKKFDDIVKDYYKNN
jgi:hypothetical protein